MPRMAHRTLPRLDGPVGLLALGPSRRPRRRTDGARYPSAPASFRSARRSRAATATGRASGRRYASLGALRAGSAKVQQLCSFERIGPKSRPAFHRSWLMPVDDMLHLPTRQGDLRFRAASTGGCRAKAFFRGVLDGREFWHEALFPFPPRLGYPLLRSAGARDREARSFGPSNQSVRRRSSLLAAVGRRRFPRPLLRLARFPRLLPAGGGHYRHRPVRGLPPISSRRDGYRPLA